jgi:hypothetical protein
MIIIYSDFMKKSALLCVLLQLLPAMAAKAVDFTFARPGVRANSMGSAFSTVDGDAYAVFYNPAGLTTLTDVETRFETARRLEPGVDEGESSLVYVRPVPDTQNKVAGLGYYAERQKGGSADYLVMGAISAWVSTPASALPPRPGSKPRWCFPT